MRVKQLYKAPRGSLKNVGCILLAAGQGSRLGISGPKGTFPVLGKSLFQWICERVPSQSCPIAIMTSPLNHQETLAFFAKHHNFGKEVHFFQQGMLPYLDDAKQPLDVEGPDGNGSVYRAFAASPLQNLFLARGIDLVTMIPVDNPLADPADLRLIGHARATRADVVVKCVKRKESDTSMGALVEREGRLSIVEYIDLDPSLSYRYSYIGQMAMTLPFLLRMAQVDLPLHWVQKKIPGQNILAWKREKFLFDVLPYGNAEALCYPRNLCYAPIKSLDEVSAVERLLSRQMREGYAPSIRSILL